MKLHIKKGDKVIVLAGDAKGKEGEVQSVDLQKQRAVVQGVNFVSKHIKARANAKYPDGGIIKMEGPIHVSNLQFQKPVNQRKQVIRWMRKQVKRPVFSKQKKRRAVKNELFTRVKG